MRKAGTHRSKSPAQLTDLREQVYQVLLRAGCPLPMAEIVERCAAFATPHYLRTSLLELHQRGRIRQLHKPNAFHPAGRWCAHYEVITQGRSS